MNVGAAIGRPYFNEATASLVSIIYYLLSKPKGRPMGAPAVYNS